MLHGESVVQIWTLVTGAAAAGSRLLPRLCRGAQAARPRQASRQAAPLGSTSAGPAAALEERRARPAWPRIQARKPSTRVPEAGLRMPAVGEPRVREQAPERVRPGPGPAEW